MPFLLRTPEHNSNMMKPSFRFMGSVVMTTASLSFIAATLGMAQRLEPFFTWYYLFSWWSYIFFLEGFLYWRSARSALFDTPKRFLIQLPLSVTIWLFFELFNFRLQNWHYIHVPSNLLVRWFGYVISFATVLPGLNATAGLVRELKIFPSDQQWTSFAVRTATRRLSLGLGLLLLALPVIWPLFFFPLVWLGFIMLLWSFDWCADPNGLCKDLRSGRPHKLFELLLAGMICGFLWEFWNYWAGAKWVYTVPYVGWLKVFEMPLLGFLGFPPFAVECYLMSGCAFYLLDLLGAGQNPGKRWIIRVFLGLCLLVFWGLVFSGIDRYTVVSFGA